jgi:hypothetical protein
VDQVRVQERQYGMGLKIGISAPPGLLEEYRQVAVPREGIEDWAEAGLPLESGTKA